MSEQNKNGGPVEFEPKDFHGTLTSEDKTMAAIQEQLDHLADDAKIRISRVDPVWCAGHLETVHLVDSTQPLDIDAIIKRWGGQRLQIKILNQKGQIKGGGTIACFSYRPRVRGKEITEEMLIENGALPGPLQPPAHHSPPSQPVQNPLAALGLDVPSLIKIAQGSGGKDGGLSAKLVEQALYMQQQAMAQAAQQAAPNMTAQFEQFMGMFKLFGEMKNMFGGGDGGGGGGDADSMMPMLGQLLSGVMQKQQQQSAPPPRRRSKPFIVPPGQADAQQPPPPPFGAAAPPGPVGPSRALQQTVNKPTGTGDGFSLGNLAETIAQLSPKDASDVAVQAFGGMPEQKRQETMELFMGEVFEDDVDDSSNQDDTDRYEQQSLEPPISNQNGFSPSPGGPIRANEGDNPPYRDGDS